ncbi:hypothetical protein EV702DRAFT_1049229 [Suillus placidus]|uniref:Uncharacterized protein n=1 Tax=Suillus placidus TaxID=48579 RepID=A0A9P7CYG8_9AGAM|nr:hypothetical protein EV702DRAFT_1049229 [Suillus placidus]
MSTPVDTSLTGLKASTAQIVAIIAGTQVLPLGPSHFSLGKQAQVVRDYKDGPLPSIMLSCSRELIQVWSMTPQVWPNWHSIGYNSPHLLRHIWCSNILAWEALGDHTFDLPVSAPPSTGPIPVTLPSPPVPASNIAGSSGNPTTESQDKGKESEDDDEPIIKPFSGGVPEVVLPQLSSILVRTPNSPHSPQVPMKKSFGPVKSFPAVIKPVQPTPEPLVEAPQIDLEQPISGLQQARLALHNSARQEDWKHVHVLSRTPSKAGSKAPPISQSKAQTRSQSRGPSSTSGITVVTTPKTQTCGCSKTITAVHVPAAVPAPALASLPSLSLAVPHSALDMPMPDLHAMAIAIQDAAARIALLEACVEEQDGKIDTLQYLHGGLRQEIIDWHPSFPLLDPPANATSLLLDQAMPEATSPPKSALPSLAHLPMAGVELTPPKINTPYAIEDLMFELSQVQPPLDSLPTPPGPLITREIVQADDAGNLFLGYNSDSEMDVEVEVEEVEVEASFETAMAIKMK